MWATHVDLDGLRYGYVLVIDLQGDYGVTLNDMRMKDMTVKFKAFESNITSAADIMDGWSCPRTR